MQDIQFRIATLNDLDSLKCLYQQLIPEANPQAADMGIFLRQIAQSETNFIFIAELNNEIIGSAQLVLYENLIRAPFWKGLIDSVIINESYQGFGIGTRLFDAIDQFCVSRGVTKLNLVSSYKRYKAYSFYRKVGYQDCGLGFVKDL